MGIPGIGTATGGGIGDWIVPRGSWWSNLQSSVNKMPMSSVYGILSLLGNYGQAIGGDTPMGRLGGAAGQAAQAMTMLELLKAITADSISDKKVKLEDIAALTVPGLATAGGKGINTGG